MAEEQPKKPTKKTFAFTTVAHLARLAKDGEEKLKKGQKFRIFYAGAFGIHKLEKIRNVDGDFLEIELKDKQGNHSTIIAPAIQCSFRAEFFTPQTAEERKESAIGFTV